MCAQVKFRKGLIIFVFEIFDFGKDLYGYLFEVLMLEYLVVFENFLMVLDIGKTGLGVKKKGLEGQELLCSAKMAYMKVVLGGNMGDFREIGRNCGVVRRWPR